MSLLSSLAQLKGMCPSCLGIGREANPFSSLCLLLPIPSASRDTALGQLPAPLLENAPESGYASAGVHCKPSTGSAGPGNPQIQVPKCTPCRALHCKPDYLKHREIYFQLDPGISLCLEARREEGEIFPQSFELVCGNNNLVLQLQGPNPISFLLGYEFLPTPGAPGPPWSCHSGVTSLPPPPLPARISPWTP